MQHIAKQDDDDSFIATTAMRNNESFQEEYKYYRSLGENHICAMNRARDYYNLHLAREVSLNEVTDTDASGFYTDESTVEKIHFNQVVRGILALVDKEQTTLLWYLIVKEDLDQYLDDELYIQCSATVHTRPETLHEIARSMGLRVNKSNISNDLWALKTKLQDRLAAANFGR